MSNRSYRTTKGGYENLIVYKLGTVIYDLTVIFCKKYISVTSRTTDQMIQAARSGKQNIVEGSLENSIEGNLKLTGVARASYGELIEDYKDYLRQHQLKLWSKDDTRVLELRRVRDFSYETYKPYQTYMSYTHNPENYSNLLLTLCYKQLFLLHRLLNAVEERFVKQGGFRENLFRKRTEFKRII